MEKHLLEKHPYVPPAVRATPKPPPPPPTVKSFNYNQIPEKTTLLGGKNVDIGDTIFIVKKVTIVKITKTVDSSDIQVEYVQSKSNWQFNQPI